MQQQNDDLQATKSIQHDLRATLQQQNDDLRATPQQQNDSLQATVQQQKADGLQKHVQHLQHDNLQTIIHDSMTFELTYYRNRMDNNMFYQSPSFYTSPNGYNMNIKVYANGYGEDKGSHVSVSACVIKGKYDDDLNWPFVGDITFKLLNQLEDKKDHSQLSTITSENNLRTQSCWGSPQFYSIHSLLNDSNSTTEYLKNDTLYFRISVQASGHRPWSTDMEKKIVEVNERSHVMTFKLPGYKEKKDNNEVFISPSFYTSPNGYQMKIVVYLNGKGDGEGTHVSIYALRLKGPFAGIIQFELLNHLRDKDHHSQDIPFSPDCNFIVNQGRGEPRYIPHSYLESDSPYLQDDTLYFRVSVEEHQTPIHCG